MHSETNERAEPAVSETAVRAGDSAAHLPPARQETILIADDSDAVRTLVARILRKTGYTVLEAQHGCEALRLYAEHAGGIDLLLTDVMMPEMSGPDLVRQLLSSYPNTRVIFMSAYTDDDFVHEGVAHLSAAFIQKPMTPASLAKKVREVLDSGRAG